MDPLSHPGTSSSPVPHPAAPDPVSPRPGIADRLATLIRIPTVSTERTEHTDAFIRFPQELERLYPLIHARLERRIVDGTGLLFRWRGTSPAEPLVLMAHWDVVPAPTAWQRTGWQTDPFAGEILDHPPVTGERFTAETGPAVTGRGALDDKGPLVVLLEAVENLLAAGFTPAQDVWLVLGGDEEVQGTDAVAMSELVRTELGGTEPWLVLDEGGAVTDSPLSFVDGTCAMIGLAEKGVLTVRLTAAGGGGHASSPPAKTPVSRLLRALRRIERSPFTARLNTTTAAMLGAFAPLTSGAASRLIPTAAQAGPVTARALAAMGGEAAALVRTTVAVTRLQAGSADNVLPDEATATLNCRIAPGDTVESVVEGLRRRIKDREIRIETSEGHGSSPESPADGAAFASVRDAVGISWPEATPVPYLLMAATDSRHFHTWCQNVYRFAPLQMGAEQRAGIHGENEWVSQDSLERGELFHRSLILGRGGEFGTAAAGGLR